MIIEVWCITYLVDYVVYVISALLQYYNNLRHMQCTR